MDEELQELRVRVQQLEAERSRLQQERDSALASSNRQDDVQAGPSTSGTPTNRGADRIIYLPRERKCPIFRGTHGVGVEDWIEEVRTSMRVRHVGPTDQAAFIFDHLEGEARDEIKYRSSSERGLLFTETCNDWSQQAPEENIDEDDVASGSWLVLRETGSNAAMPLVQEPSDIPTVRTPVEVPQSPQTSQSSRVGPRRSTRKTAGKHSNPHRLPVPARNEDSGAAASLIPGASSLATAIFRPWS
ncbi:uncharacterized protein LOC119774915 [Cyprinodon tularosa]|uniref:uncharacterized protein LOC119774915 n=1 Tax=Cyprinodon tularosa TaxID=77115 RepID=UPI0018E208DB|nr:uncharacterized protein LOC119774915 [Cyprinodon tularosa]